MRILLVEDDQRLQHNLQQHLSAASYSVDIAADGEDGLFKGSEYQYDAAIIDVGLPKLDGLSLIKTLRSQNVDYPILILTARDGWQDKVLGLDTGADDYLSKPFQAEELIARLNALIRRNSGKTSPLISNGPFTLNTRTLEVKLNDQLRVLSSHEYKLFEYFMLHQNEVISKSTLTEHIYNEDFDLDSNVIEVFVGRLRKKLDENQQYKLIQTLRGQGYRMRQLEHT